LGGLLIGALGDVDLDDAVARVVMLGRHEESEALTGRLPIWNTLLGYIEARPLQGYGYESFWTTRNIETATDILGWPLREAHNAAIDGLLSVGAVGLGLFLAAVLLALFRAAAAHRKAPDLGFDFVLGMLVFGVANACLESGMMSSSFLTLVAGSGVVYLAFSPTAIQETASGQPKIAQLPSTSLAPSP
jgi:exopolysaccharide production protein ExoQ